MPTTAIAHGERFARFVQDFGALLDAAPAEPEIIDRGGALLAALVGHDDWLHPACTVPHERFYQQFPLHVDAQGRFSVVSFVWGPGQATPIHDHTVWGLIGMLRGQERAQAFRQDAQGRWQPHGEPHLLQPGQVDAVSPTIGDVHQVSNALAERPSISIHVYGADIGAVRRSVYQPDGTRREFVSGYTQP